MPNGQRCADEKCTMCEKPDCECNQFVEKSGPLNFGLDYDGTYSAAPELWNSIINLIHAAGHKVYIVTARDGDTVWGDPVREVIGDKVPIIFTWNQQKKSYTLSKGIDIDIWIDDNPNWIP